MRYQHAYHLSLAAFGVFAVVSVYEYLCVRSPEPKLVVDDPEQTLPGLIVNRKYIVDFRLHNHGSRTLRVVGVEFT